MIWKHVFDGNKIGHLAQSAAGLVAIRAGYKFMAYGSIVYFNAPDELHNKFRWIDTGLRVNKNGDII